MIVVGSAHASPGATTTLLGLAAAWPSEVVVVEADPDGGVLAARFSRELSADRTLADAVVDVRRGFTSDRFMESARRLWGAVPVVVAPPSAEKCNSALSAGAERLGAGLVSREFDVLVDVGRLTPCSPVLPLARAAEVILMVTRPTFENAALLVPRVSDLRAGGCEVSLVVVGEGPYAPDEIAAAVEAPLVGVVPFEPRAAALLSGGPGSNRRLRRSLLWRALTELAGRLATPTGTPSTGNEREASTALARPAPTAHEAEVRR